MTFFALSEKLSAKKAVVVHFSHHAQMRDGGLFPQDLEEAMSNCHVWALSCCVLWPEHNMNLPGSVGIIFSPKPNHVLSVSPSDSGSYMKSDGTDGSLGQELSLQSFEDTFHPNFNSYNEWRVRGADVAGLFVAVPNHIMVKQCVSLSKGDFQMETIAATPVSLDYIFDCFPNMKIFTLGANGLEVLSKPNSQGV